MFKKEDIQIFENTIKALARAKFDDMTTNECMAIGQIVNRFKVLVEDLKAKQAVQTKIEAATPEVLKEQKIEKLKKKPKK